MAEPRHDLQMTRPRLAGGRLGRMVAGYLLGCLVAIILLPLAMLARDILVLGPTAAVGAVHLADLMLIVVIGLPIAVILAAPFATATLVLTTSARLDALWVHALAGAIIGALVGAIASVMPAVSGQAGNVSGLGAAVFLVYAAVGAAGGATYWFASIRAR